MSWFRRKRGGNGSAFEPVDMAALTARLLKEKQTRLELGKERARLLFPGLLTGDSLS